MNTDILAELPLLIVCEDQAEAEALRGALVRCGLPQPAIANDRGSAFLELGRQEYRAVICHVRSREDQDALAFVEQLHAECPDACLLAVIHQDQTSLAAVAVASGADNCVAANAPASEVVQILSRTLQKLACRAASPSLEARSHPNQLRSRASLASDLDSLITRTPPGEQRAALALIDLDNLSSINHQFGYQYGNRLLEATWKAAHQLVQASEKLYRWGDDEMAIVFTDIASEREVQQRCLRLKNALEKGLCNERLDALLTFSVGFALGQNADQSVDRLIRNADLALKEAKRQGGNLCFSFASIANVDQKLLLFGQRQRLKAAINERQIEVHFQPIVRADGTPCKIEALARWQDGDRGYISPGLFIPMAEEMGLIQDLSQCVLEQCVSALAEAKDRGYDLACSINVSRKQLDLADLVARFAETVEALHGDASRIVIEITESASCSDEEQARQRMREFQRTGFRLSIDDFGTGQSTFAQLSHASFDELKIDRSLIATLRSPKGLYIMRSIIGMAKKLNLDIVAEGVEDLVTVNLLRSMEVDLFQGFFFARPMPLKGLMQFFEQPRRNLLLN